MISPKGKIIKRQPIAEYVQIRKYVVDTVWNSGTSPQRIASVRELAAMFNVSTMTIQRALKKLTDDGFLIARPGIGLFTNPEHRWKYGNINVIGVLVADGKQIYFEKYLWELLSTVGKEITESRKLLYQVNFLSESNDLEECVAGIPMKGLIWLDPEFEPSVAMEEFVNSLTIPVVVVNGHRPGRSCVCNDWELEGYEIGRKLLAEGRRRPLLAAKHDHMPQLDGLRRAFREAGVSLDTDEMLILRGLEMENNLNRLLETNAQHISGTLENLDTMTGDLSGLLASERRNLQAAVENLTEFSVMLGENAPRVDSMMGNLNRITTELAEAGFARELSETVAGMNALLERIDRIAGEEQKHPAILLEVNISGEESKFGPFALRAERFAAADVQRTFFSESRSARSAAFAALRSAFACIFSGLRPKSEKWT